MDGFTHQEIILSMAAARTTRRGFISNQAPPSSLEFSRAYQPTIEDMPDDAMTDTSSASTTYSSTGSSRNSFIEYFIQAGDDDADEDVENLTNPTPPPCRRDLAHEVARSLWGLVAPLNFDMVMPGVYRSSYPKPENYQFLKALGIKTVLMLVTEQRPAEYTEYMADRRIAFHQIPIAKNKTSCDTISQVSIASALSIILDKRNHPMLIHCNKGKHRTGCVVGCLRKVQGWTMGKVINEYRHFAAEKARPLDERFLDLFNAEALQWMTGQAFSTVQAELTEESPITNTAAMSTRLRG